MGKKSLIKSTSKKSAPKKAASAVKTENKAAAKQAPPAKKPAAQSTPAKQEAPKPKGKPLSVKDLLKKKFDRVIPDVLYTVPEEKADTSTFTAPERLAGYDSKDAERIKGLLANKYSEKDLKAAAEKAAAEKAAAEKAAAEKAAAEKAAAEKAAAEKAAAEKAAAEKAAAEKAAAIRQAAAQKSDVTVSYEPPPTKVAARKPSDPVDNTIKLFAAGLAFLILLVIGASASNSFKYYLTENQGALEVWKGTFAPMGKKKVIALPGILAPEAPKNTYRAGEVYPMIFQYYIDKADALLDVSGIPDFEGIKATLKTALEYGNTSALRAVAYERLDNIDYLILTYKADVAASRRNMDDLQSAIGFLKEAKKLTANQAQKALIDQKIAAHEAAIIALREQAAAEAAAVEAVQEGSEGPAGSE
jgi:colicin import membrane protein